MADFYRVHGGAGEVDTFYNFMGKTLKAFAIQVRDGSNNPVDLSGQMGPNGAVPAIINALEGNASVVAYQVNNATENGLISVLLETAEQHTASMVAGIVASAGNNGVIPTGIYGNTSVTVTGTRASDEGFTLYPSWDM
jgi:hypothetical protein